MRAANARPWRAPAFLLAAAAAATASSATSTGGPCDAVIPGPWTGFFPGPLNDLYLFSWSSREARNWTVHNPNRGNESLLRWDNAVGQFVEDWLSTTSFIDGGGDLGGKVAADCSAIAWDNGSVWKPRPAPTPVRVHISPHSHDDLGWCESYLEYFYGNGTSNGPQGYYNVT